MKARELTAEDVVWAFEHRYSQFEEAGLATGYYMALFDSITATDRYRVTIKLNGFDPEWNFLWGYGGWARIYPEELVDAGKEDWRNGVGTGPFMIEDYVDASAL